MLTKADKWLTTVILSFAIAGIGLNMYNISGVIIQERSAIVTVNGQIVKRFPLRQGYSGEFKLGSDSGFNVIEYKDNRVRIRKSDCPDQICVQSGWISAPPQQVVCLPYRVVVKVVTDSPADVDDIVR